jgi:hypothetical protein
MRKAARRESAKAWLDTGAQITVKMYARRYGVDRYTAREDLEAIGFVFAPGDTRWSKRPEPVPRKVKADRDGGSDLDDWVWCGDPGRDTAQHERSAGQGRRGPLRHQPPVAERGSGWKGSADPWTGVLCRGYSAVTTYRGGA